MIEQPKNEEEQQQMEMIKSYSPDVLYCHYSAVCRDGFGVGGEQGSLTSGLGTESSCENSGWASRRGRDRLSQ